MNCNDVQAQLSAYLDGKDMQPASNHLKQHLANCVRCGDALQKEIEMRVLLRELKDLPVPNQTVDFANRAFEAAFTQQRVAAVQQEDENNASAFALNVMATGKVSAEISGDKSSVVSFNRGVKGGHAASLAMNANKQQHHFRRQGFYWGFSSAAAVALMMWGVSAMMLTSPTSNHPSAQLASATLNANDQRVEPSIEKSSVALGNKTDAPVLQVALHEMKQVKLAFKAQKAVENARISISLPDNVMLKGYPGKRTIEWETQLAAGDNILSLPILADQLIAAGESDILVARVSHNGGENTLSVRLQVVKPGMSQMESKSRTSA